jgi:hypothetical protein
MGQMEIICKGPVPKTVLDKYVQDDKGLYYNKRLEKEIQKKKDYCETQAKNLGEWKGLTKEQIAEKKAKMAKNETKPPPEAPPTQGESKNTEETKGRAVVFKPPTVEEVAGYCNERKNGIDPIAFLNHYETVGWRYGNGSGKPVKDWQACVRTWEDKRNKDSKGVVEHGQRPGQNFVSGNVKAEFKKS